MTCRIHNTKTEGIGRRRQNMSADERNSFLCVSFFRLLLLLLISGWSLYSQPTVERNGELCSETWKWKVIWTVNRIRMRCVGIYTQFDFRITSTYRPGNRQNFGKKTEKVPCGQCKWNKIVIHRFPKGQSPLFAFEFVSIRVVYVRFGGKSIAHMYTQTTYNFPGIFFPCPFSLMLPLWMRAAVTCFLCDQSDQRSNAHQNYGWI